MVARIILVDDDQIQFEEGEHLQDITEAYQELFDEHNELMEYLEQVELSFSQAQGTAPTPETPQRVELSHEALELARGTKGSGAMKVMGKAAPTVGAAGSAGRTSAAGANFNNVAAKLKSAVGKGKLPVAAGTGGAPKGASIAKHLKHAAKLVGRFAGKHKTAAAAAGGAAIGASIANKFGHKLSQEPLQLETQAPEGLVDLDFTDEELAQMTPEEAQAILAEAEEELTEEQIDELNADIDEGYRENLANFAQSVLVSDAESRTAKK